MKGHRAPAERDAVVLVEEAVHLLRQAPASAWAVYLAGAVPFVLGLLFFWAHTTWFRPSEEAVAWQALGLAALFLLMKTAQSEFCAGLMARRFGDEPAPWSWRQRFSVAGTQLRVQPWALLGVAAASIVAFPFGWVFAYAQILTVLGGGARPHDDAVAHAKRWPAQNHLGLLLITGVGVCVWFNGITAVIVLPWLANRLLGIENVFGLSGWSVFNTTLLAAVTALTWLAVDPLVKAFYTLWVFYGRARSSGDDIRVEFGRARRAPSPNVPSGAPGVAVRAVEPDAAAATQRSRIAPSAARAVLAVVGLAFLVTTAGVTRAAVAPSTAPAAAAPGAVQPAALDRAIDGVLAGPDFAWRLRPPPAPARKSSDGWFMRFARKGADLIRSMFHTLGGWIRAVVEWLGRHLSPPSPTGIAPAASGGAAVLPVLLYGFIAVIVGLLLWLIWIIIRQARANAAVVVARPVGTAAPDLRDENVQAAQLPADGWLALARQEMARGDWRLALRALYLATLARLAAEGLIGLALFKTNLDYERELRRRALSRTDVVSRFAQRRRAFEAVWYGRAAPDEAAVRTWLTELEPPGPAA